MSEPFVAQDAKAPLPEIPGYRITRVIGHGGMATVYLGTQVSLGRDVAIKVMLPEALADEVSRRRFENEARTIARLEHPNIVGIHEVGRTAQGLPWYSMPHLPHGHLGQRNLTGDQRRIREVLRALLSGERPYIFMKHFYACASLIGALATYFLWSVLGGGYAMAVGFVLILAMRLLAAKYHWSLPRA